MPFLVSSSLFLSTFSFFISPVSFLRLFIAQALNAALRHLTAHSYLKDSIPQKRHFGITRIFTTQSRRAGSSHFDIIHIVRIRSREARDVGITRIVMPPPDLPSPL